MKPIDRVYTALYHEEPDKIPDSRDIASLGNIFDREVIISGVNFTIWKSPFGSLHLDYVNPTTGISSDVFEYGWVRPEDFVWWHTISPAVRWPEDLDKIEPPKPNERRIESAKKAAKELHEKGYFVIIGHHSAFDSSWRYLRGFKQWLIDIKRDISFAKRVIEFAIKPQIEITNIYLEETKADAVYVTRLRYTQRPVHLTPSL